MEIATRIGVVGGGMSGLTLCKALRSAGFANVFLFEKKDHLEQLEDYHAPLFLATNGVTALRSLGLEDVIKSSHRFQRVLQHDAGMSVYASSDLSVRGKYKHGGLAIPKSQLLDGLLAHVPDSSVHWGHHLTEVEEVDTRKKPSDEGNLVLHFANQAPVPVHLLVGCDGLNSTVRTIMRTGSATGSPRKMREDPQAWLVRGVSSIPNSWSGEERQDLLPENKLFQIHVEGTIMGWKQISSQQIGWFLLDSRGQQISEQQLKTLFTHLPSSVQKILQNVDTDSVSSRPSLDLEGFRDWHNGRNIVLAGDAAHAMRENLLQDAASCLESSLALSLALTEYTPMDALEEYQKFVAPRILDRQAKAHVEAVDQQVTQSFKGWRKMALKFMPPQESADSINLGFDVTRAWSSR